jgi:uncharacterized Fe-S cluster-containing radical SAM superfamily enzyme
LKLAGELLHRVKVPVRRDDRLALEQDLDGTGVVVVSQQFLEALVSFVLKWKGQNIISWNTNQTVLTRDPASLDTFFLRANISINFEPDPTEHV